VADIWDIDKHNCTWVMKTALIKSRWRTMASWHLAEAGRSGQEGRRRHQAWRRSDTRQYRGFAGFILKAIDEVWWFRPQNYRCGFGGLGLKTVGDRFTGLGLKTWMKVLRKNGWHVVASRSSCRGKATGEGARWPLDEDDTGLDHNALGLSGLTQLYPRANQVLCNSPVK
jgi:hypothetical protein